MKKTLPNDSPLTKIVQENGNCTVADENCVIFGPSGKDPTCKIEDATSLIIKKTEVEIRTMRNTLFELEALDDCDGNKVAGIQDLISKMDDSKDWIANRTQKVRL